MTPFDRENIPIYDIINQIFDAPERADREGQSSVRGRGHGPDRPFGMEYEFAIDWGVDPVEPPIEDGPISEEVDEYLIDGRQEDDEMRVVADLPGVKDSEMTVQSTEDYRFLEITTGEEMIERIPLPWAAEIETTRFNNGVLDIRLVRIDEGGNEQRSADERVE